MSENGEALEADPSSEYNRYRVLLEITDMVARAKSLPEAIQRTRLPIAGLDGRRVAESFPA